MQLMMVLHFERITDDLYMSIIKRIFVSSDFINRSNDSNLPTRKKNLVFPSSNSSLHPVDRISAAHNFFMSSKTNSFGRNGLYLLYKSV